MLANRPASTEEAIDALLAEPWLESLTTAHRVIEARPPRHAPWPDDLDPRLVGALRGRGVEALWTHQAQALATVRRRENAVVVTPTASGKTLCYNLPVLDAIARDDTARALYLFPTKALAADQLVELRALAEAAELDLKTSTYDGDTPPAVRSVVRAAGQVVISNPDMLHAGILPHHTKWFKLFENLQYVVIDELHTYRGLFGSHLANVLRRLQRVCRHYGSDPVFICASATIANPGELAARLIGAPVTVIDDDGAPRGRRHVLIVNPPLVNEALGIRASSLLTAKRIAEQLIGDGVQTIVFGRSRTTVEVMTTYLREALPAAPGHQSSIRGYRGGYLPNERRDIERGLRDGRVRGVVATNALELGIDIGSLDAAISIGYPGTIASTWQQLGRAGRRAGTALSVLVASSAPIDQFLAMHPDWFFDRPPEHGLVNPDNLHLLLDHLRASTFELPVPADEAFGIVETAALLDVLEEDGFVRRASDDRYHWSHENFPASAFSLRSAAQENVVILDTTTDPHRVIGEVDLFAAPLLLHEQAIYLHESVQYHVDRLDWDERKAYVRRVDIDYYTDADLGVTLKVLDVADETDAGAGGARARGEVMVAWHVTMFKKIKFHTHENVGWGPVNLPEQQMHTAATWIVLPDAACARFNRETLDGALIGLARLARNTAPLLLMCDARDLGVQAQAQAPFTGKPTLYLYDAVPGGVGLSERIHDLWSDLLAVCRDLVRDCPCLEGCPGCVGPPAEVGIRGKAAATELLETLVAGSRP
ncbi:MAG TPA: DEAD/DEAH box helicase [Candidatus Limnocylindria bacterium]|jgi:DEAD/DEAH box helicase domain-containing protein|nr:DEAD/DEAH box helicase [Candidatus Limnocylindria bacterium]